MKIAKIFLALCIIAGIISATIPPLTGKVIGVKDGDTIVVLIGKEATTIRLVDIDCPEKKQAFGAKAKEFTSNLCFGKHVKIYTGNGKLDRYKRILGTVYVGNINVNRELVKAGFAWNYKYSKRKDYVDLEREARTKKRGLWIEKNPIAPWDFRKQSRKPATTK